MVCFCSYFTCSSLSCVFPLLSFSVEPPDFLSASVSRLHFCFPFFSLPVLFFARTLFYVSRIQLRVALSCQCYSFQKHHLTASSCGSAVGVLTLAVRPPWSSTMLAFPSGDSKTVLHLHRAQVLTTTTPTLICHDYIQSCEFKLNFDASFSDKFKICGCLSQTSILGR